MSQYICWVKENRRVKSLTMLKDWTAKEAEYQIQATEIKHGLKSGNTNGKLHDRKSRSYRINQTDNKKKGIHVCKVCSVSHAVWNPGGYSQKNWVGVCSLLPKTHTLFMTKICDIPYPVYDLIKNSKLNLWPDPYIKFLFQTCILISSVDQNNFKLL